MPLIFSSEHNKENIPPQKKWRLRASTNLLNAINNHPIISKNRAGFSRQDAETKTLTDLSRSEKPLRIEDKQFVIHDPSIRSAPPDLEKLRENGQVNLIDATDRDLAAKMLGNALSQNYGLTLGKYLLDNLHQDGCKTLGQTFLGAQFSTELSSKAKCSSADVSLKATKLGTLITEEFDVNTITNFSDPENLITHQNKSGQPLARVKTVSLLTRDPETHEPSLKIVGMVIDGYTHSQEIKSMFKEAFTKASQYAPEVGKDNSAKPKIR